VAERNGMTLWKEIEWRGLRHCVYSVCRENQPQRKPWPVFGRWSNEGPAHRS